MENLRRVEAEEIGDINRILIEVRREMQMKNFCTREETEYI